jgi:hypothetical protein
LPRQAKPRRLAKSRPCPPGDSSFLVNAGSCLVPTTGPAGTNRAVTCLYDRTGPAIPRLDALVPCQSRPARLIYSGLLLAASNRCDKPISYRVNPCRAGTDVPLHSSTVPTETTILVFSNRSISVRRARPCHVSSCQAFSCATCQTFPDLAVNKSALARSTCHACACRVDPSPTVPDRQSRPHSVLAGTTFHVWLHHASSVRLSNLTSDLSWPCQADWPCHAVSSHLTSTSQHISVLFIMTCHALSSLHIATCQVSGASLLVMPCPLD